MALTWPTKLREREVELLLLLLLLLLLREFGLAGERAPKNWGGGLVGMGRPTDDT